MQTQDHDQQPKRGRGRPKGSGKPPKPYIDQEDGDYLTATDLKSQMTTKELKFLELYMTGDYTREKAMIAAGYNDLHPRYRYFLASKIIQKHETQTADSRFLARSMGAGEVLVFQTLLSLIKSKNDRIKLDATINLAKILGLTKEQIERAPGLTIVFEGGSDQPRQADRIVAVDEAQEQAQPAPRYEDRHIPGRTLQITR